MAEDIVLVRGGVLRLSMLMTSCGSIGGPSVLSRRHGR
jgi:hypothetical protein